jgi:carbon-monoxide dehydrogenase large subunit
MCGLAPSRVLGSLNYAAGGWENASVRMLATGKVEVVVGTSPHGQGHETAFSQIVADRLGVAFDDIEIIHGDTQSSVKGMDSYGSRSLVVGGIAVVHAADKVVAKARRIAAHQLEANEDDLEFAGGSFNVKGMPSGSAGSSMSMGEIAFATFTAHNLPDGMEPSLDSDATFDPENFSFPHGTHLCAIDVDTETGRSTIRKYVCVDDVGTPINPLIVEGQVHGGLAQGIAQALFEEAVFDDAGNLTTGTFVDYTIPSAADLPSFTTDRTETPATSNPLGVKGVGEAGTIASTPAVVNAIVDALRPFGVNDIQMPATPERVWRAVHSGAEKSGRAEGGTTAYGGASTSTSDGSGAEGDQL